MGNVAGAGRKRFELWLETAKKAKSRAAQVCNRHRKSQSQAEVEAKKRNQPSQTQIGTKRNLVNCCYCYSCHCAWLLFLLTAF